MRRKEDRTSQILDLLVRKKKLEVAEPENTALPFCPELMISRDGLPTTTKRSDRSQYVRQNS